MWLRLFLVALTLIQLNFVKGTMKGFVVGGGETTIEKYPHAVHLRGHCLNALWLCGSSILTQRILLTAAHCVDTCDWKRKKKSRLLAYVGHTNLKEVKVQTPVVDLILHEKYDEETFYNDVAILLLKTKIVLGPRAKRVVIPIRYPKVKRNCYVAGWGTTNRAETKSSIVLKHVDQTIRSKQTCALIGRLHKGTLCAGSTKRDADYPARGDSGSALLYAGYLELGLVSFYIKKYPALNVYTNVTYYYTWISRNAAKLHCDNQ